MIAALEVKIAEFTSHINCLIKLYIYQKIYCHKNLPNKKSAVALANLSAECAVLHLVNEQIDKK